MIFFGGIFFCIYFFFFATYPTCFDGIQNQDETGVDCGGHCVSCELKNARIDAFPATVLSGGELRSTVAVPIKNIATHYGVYRFDYTVTVFSDFGTELGTYVGVSSLMPSEEKYIVVPNIAIDPRDIDKVTVDTQNEIWKSEGELQRTTFNFDEVETHILSSDIRTTGVIRNEGANAFSGVLVTGLLFSRDGAMLGASKTKVSYVPAYDEAAFELFYPRTNDAVRYIDHSKTQIFYELERL
jgi:hypothetical protein